MVTMLREPITGREFPVESDEPLDQVDKQEIITAFQQREGIQTRRPGFKFPDVPGGLAPPLSEEQEQQLLGAPAIEGPETPDILKKTFPMLVSAPQEPGFIPEIKRFGLGIFDALSLLQRSSGVLRGKLPGQISQRLEDPTATFFRPEAEALRKLKKPLGVFPQVETLLEIGAFTLETIPDLLAGSIGLARKAIKTVGKKAGFQPSIIEGIEELVEKGTGIEPAALRKAGFFGERLKPFINKEPEIARRILTNLDNFEDALPEAATVEALLNAMPRIKLDNAKAFLRAESDKILLKGVTPQVENKINRLIKAFEDLDPTGGKVLEKAVPLRKGVVEALEQPRTFQEIQQRLLVAPSSRISPILLKPEKAVTKPLTSIADLTKRIELVRREAFVGGVPAVIQEPGIGLTATKFRQLRKEIDNIITSKPTKEFTGIQNVMLGLRRQLAQDLRNAAQQTGNVEFIGAMDSFSRKLVARDEILQFIGRNELKQQDALVRRLRQVGAERSETIEEVVQKFDNIFGGNATEEARNAFLASQLSRQGKVPILSQRGGILMLLSPKLLGKILKGADAAKAVKDGIKTGAFALEPSVEKLGRAGVLADIVETLQNLQTGQPRQEGGATGEF